MELKDQIYVFVVQYFPTPTKAKFGGVFSGQTIAREAAKSLRNRFGCDAFVTRFLINNLSEGEMIGMEIVL